MAVEVEMDPLYNCLAQPLDTAQTDKEFNYPGTFLEFATDGTMTGVSVRIGSKTADSIPLDGFKGKKFPAGFDEFYVTWTAQAGKTLYIFVGREGSQARRV